MRILIHVGSTDVDIDISSWSSSRQKTSRMTRDNLIVKGLMQYFISDEGICLGIRDTGRFACVSRVFGLTALQYDDPFIKRVIDARLKQCPTLLQPTEATYNGISECWRFICCSTEASTKELKIQEHGNSSKDKDVQTSKVTGMVIQIAGNTPVAEIIIPEVISSIGCKAFMDNKGVKVIIMPNRVKLIGSYAFENCGLQKCIFPTSPIQIGFRAFARSSIKNAIIPADSRICESAFEACHSLHSVGMPKAIQAIGSRAFANCKCLRKMSFPGNLARLEGQLFKSSGLTEITIPDGVLLIGPEAFSGTPISKVTFTHASMLSNIGALAFNDCKQLEEIDLPRLQTLEQYCFRESGLRQIVFRSGLLAIRHGAFYGCEFLQEIQFTSRSSRTIIEECAFENCRQLISIQTLPQSVSVIRGSAFARCQSLETFQFPDGIVELGEGIFADNINMKSCTYPRHQGQMPATIPSYTFSGTGLVQFNMPNWIHSIGNYAFQDCSDLVSVEAALSTTMTIDQQAFQRCHLLQRFDIRNVSSIGCCAFDECHSLVVDEQEWMNRIIKIPAGAFRSCYKLKGIVLPEGCTEIGDQAFSNCISLRAINLPPSLSSIGSSSFKECEALTTIRLPDSMTHIGQAAFTCCMTLQSADLRCAMRIIPPQTFKDCASLREVKLPVGLITIGSMAFQNCKSLGSIVFPETLVVIEAQAFDNCSNLTLTTLPQGLGRIGMGAFSSCCALNKVEMPNGNIIVHSSAFLGCKFIPSRVVQPIPATSDNEAIDLS